MRHILPLVILPLFAALGCAHAPAPAAAAPPAVSVSRFDPAHNPVIVRMVGRQKTLTIASTPHGPAYSVNGPAGELLLSQGSLDDLRRQYPELYRHVRSALASARQENPSYEEFLDYQLIAASR